MKQPHSTLNEMHETKKCNHHGKYEWKKYCKTKVDRTTVSDPAWQQNGHTNTKQVTNNIHWISFAIIHLNSVMASSYTLMVTRQKLSISQQTDEKITSITRPSNTLIHADIPRADGQVVLGVLMFWCTSWERERERERDRENSNYGATITFK